MGGWSGHGVSSNGIGLDIVQLSEWLRLFRILYFTQPVTEAVKHYIITQRNHIDSKGSKQQLKKHLL